MGKVYWSEKYRPYKLDDLCGQENLVNIIKRLLQNADELPHILLFGPSGVGKTTLAFILAYELYGTEWKSYTMYVNASDERKLENVRDIKAFAQTSSLGASKHKFKLVILDEADHLHHTSQPALRSLMENQAKNCKFIITCNYPDKIIMPLRSRSMEINVRKATKKALLEMIDRVAKAENVQGMTDSVRRLLVRAGKGDFRRSINIMQGAVDNGVISEERVAEVTNLIDEKSLSHLFTVLKKEGLEKCIETAQKYMNKGILPESVIEAAFDVALDGGHFGGPKAMDLLTLFVEASQKLAYGTVGSIVVPWFLVKLNDIVDLSK